MDDAPVLTADSITEQVETLRRNVYVPLAGLVVALAGVTTPYAEIAAFVGAAFAMLALHRNAWPLARKTRLRVDREALTLGNAERIPLAHVTSIRCLRNPSSTVLELALRGRKDLRIRTSDETAARIFAAIGERSSRHRLVVPFRTRFAVVCPPLLVAYLIGTMPMALRPGASNGAWIALLLSLFVFAMPAAAVLAWFLGLMVRGRVIVGVDGVSTRLLLKRFVPFSAVEAVTRRGVDTIVTLQSGARLRLRTPEEPTTEADRDAEGRALFDAVSGAFTRAHQRVRVAEAAPLVARGQKSAREWLAALDRVTRAAGGYRERPVDPRELAGLVADPDASLEIRVAAAAAMTRSGDAALTARVRVAAEATADPRTRALLVQTTEATDDDGVVRVLDEASR